MRSRVTSAWKQGTLWKRISSGDNQFDRPARTIRQVLGPIHPETGVPIAFRTRLVGDVTVWETLCGENVESGTIKSPTEKALKTVLWDFSLYSGVSDEWDGSANWLTAPELESVREGTGTWGWKTAGTEPYILRTDDDTTPDILMFLCEKAYSPQFRCVMQPLPNGACARYIVWVAECEYDPSTDPRPGPYYKRPKPVKEPDFVALWRIEYPNGTIQHVLKAPFEAEGTWSHGFAKNHPLVQADFESQYGKNGRVDKIVWKEGSDTVLVDGSNIPYAILTADGMVPVPRHLGQSYIKWKSGRGTETLQTLDALGGEQFGLWFGNDAYRMRTGPLINGELAKLLRLAYADDSFFTSLKPSDALKIYYGIGSWSDGMVYGYKRGACDYVVPVYQAGLANVQGLKASILESMVRQRIWLLRPDLQQVRLSDGSTVPGLIDPLLFPPMDGRYFQKLKCRDEKIWKVVEFIGSIVLAVIPGGIAFELAKLGFDAATTYTQMLEQQRAMGPILELMESGEKFTRLTKDLGTGLQKIVAEDPPSPEQKALQDRAAGLPASTVTSPGAGSAGLAIAAAIAAAIALS